MFLPVAPFFQVIAVGDDSYPELQEEIHQMKKPKKTGIVISVLCHLIIFLILLNSVSFSKLILFFGCLVCD